jgi:hypothetical protein
VNKSRIVFDGHHADLKENKDVKEFHVGLSELGKRSRRGTLRKKQNLDLIYCNYDGFQTSKNLLVFKIKM